MEIKGHLNIVVFQMTSFVNIQESERQFWELFGQIKKPEDVDIISTPENTFSMRQSTNDPLQTMDLSHPIFIKIQETAKKYNILFHIGSVALIQNNQVLNATVLISPNEKIISPYQKIHLFDIQLQGHDPTNESATFVHGSHPATMEYMGWKMGFSICYDLRFAELYCKYQGVDLIFVPSAFLVPTGQAHWDILCRARAIENQVYVVAAAQGGTHPGGRKTYGHSLVVDPWGQKLSEVIDDSKPSVIQCILSKEAISKVRRQIPMSQHRRIKN